MALFGRERYATADDSGRRWMDHAADLRARRRGRWLLRALAWLVGLSVVFGGGWTWFSRTPTYRRLDPLQVPWVLALYVTPVQLWSQSPYAVVMWDTTQAIRDDPGRWAEIEANPALSLRSAAEIRSGKLQRTGLTVLAPGTWAITFQPFVHGGHKFSRALVATFTGEGMVESVPGATRRPNGTVEAESWSQAAKLGLVHTLVGWRVVGLTFLYAHHRATFMWPIRTAPTVGRGSS